MGREKGEDAVRHAGNDPMSKEKNTRARRTLKDEFFTPPESTRKKNPGTLTNSPQGKLSLSQKDGVRPMTWVSRTL